jgi:hypothetical protein
MTDDQLNSGLKAQSGEMKKLEVRIQKSEVKRKGGLFQLKK